MKVVLSQPVEIALRTLSAEERKKVMIWLHHLKRWETDSFVREHSRELESSEGVYVLRTNTDFRIFFTVQNDQIEVLDLATRATIMLFGHSGEQGQS